MLENKLPFGRIIQQARRKKCWTVHQLVREIGLSHRIRLSDITKIEVHGHIPPDPWTIQRMAEVLEIDLKELMFASIDNDKRLDDWNKKQAEESVTLCTYTQEKYDNYQRKAASGSPRASHRRGEGA